LNFGVGGFIKFGDAFIIEIKGVDSVIFTTKTVSNDCSPMSTTYPH
jgi:hypothetical protein